MFKINRDSSLSKDEVVRFKSIAVCICICLIVGLVETCLVGVDWHARNEALNLFFSFISRMTTFV